jgi:hypothetical protein
MSVAPPGANGTTSVIGRDGNFSDCAEATFVCSNAARRKLSASMHVMALLVIANLRSFPAADNRYPTA